MPFRPQLHQRRGSIRANTVIFLSASSVRTLSLVSSGPKSLATIIRLGVVMVYSPELLVIDVFWPFIKPTAFRATPALSYQRVASPVTGKRSPNRRTR